MNLNEFTIQLINEAFSLSDTKGEDYRVGSKYVHQNFINVGDSFDLHPSKVLAVYLKKHLDAIRNYLRTDGDSESEPIRERVKDVINYLLLAIPLVAGKHLTVDQFDDFRQQTLTTLSLGIDEEPNMSKHEAEDRLWHILDNVEAAIKEKEVSTLVHNTGAAISHMSMILYYEQE